MTDEEFKKMRKRTEQELEDLKHQAALQDKYEKMKERLFKEQWGDNWKNILSGMGDQ